MASRPSARLTNPYPGFPSQTSLSLYPSPRKLPVDSQVPSPSIGEQVPNPGCPASQPETSVDRRPFPPLPVAPALWTARPPCPSLHC